jgi:hypothetical protein
MRRGRRVLRALGMVGMVVVVGSGCGRGRPTYEYEPNVTTVYTAQPVPPIIPADAGTTAPAPGVPAGTAGATAFPATTPSTIPSTIPPTAAPPPRRPTSWVGPGARQ